MIKRFDVLMKALRAAASGAAVLVLAAGGPSGVARADDDGPGSSSPGAPGGGDAASPGGGRASTGGGDPMQFWRTNPPRRLLFGQRRPARPTARAPVRPSAPAQDFVVFAADAAAAEAMARAGFAVLSRSALTIAAGEILRVRGPAGVGRAEALRRLAAAAPTAALGENALYQRILRPSGGRVEAGAPIADAVPCAAGAVIAIIDTPVDKSHPALAGARVIALSTRPAGQPPASAAHGTAVASLLVGRPDGPAPGLAPDATLVAVDAFRRGDGGDVADAYSLIRALDLAATQDPSLLNLSLAGPANPALEAGVNAIQRRGIIVVAAAGNGGPRARPSYPAALPGVVAVAAVDQEGRPWGRSAQGPHVAFAAEGVGLRLATGGAATAAHSGTSFAAPVATAMLAGKARLWPDDEPARRLLRLTALAEDRGAPGRDPVFGHGILRARDSCGRAQQASGGAIGAPVPPADGRP